jgi:hypothetical protein
MTAIASFGTAARWARSRKPPVGRCSRLSGRSTDKTLKAEGSTSSSQADHRYRRRPAVAAEALSRLRARDRNARHRGRFGQDRAGTDRGPDRISARTISSVSRKIINARNPFAYHSTCFRLCEGRRNECLSNLSRPYRRIFQSRAI